MERKQTIYNTLLQATENSFLNLFKKHKGSYYYCALVMAEVSPPCIVAMSTEILEQIADDIVNKTESDRKKNTRNRKWSYAESPFWGFGYKEYFGEVEKIFYEDIWGQEISDMEFSNRIKDWLRIMCDVMMNLKEKKIFEKNCMIDVFINSEIQPPEGNLNVENAKVLNSDSVFKNWCQDNIVEPEDDIDWNEIWNPDMCCVTLIKPLIDKKIIAKIRRDFSPNIRINEFINLCDNPPFIVNSEFLYKRAIEIISSNPDYEGLFNVDIIKK